MEWLEGGASGSAGQRDVEANVSGLNLHMRRNERWMDGVNTWIYVCETAKNQNFRHFAYKREGHGLINPRINRMQMTRRSTGVTSYVHAFSPMHPFPGPNRPWKGKEITRVVSKSVRAVFARSLLFVVRPEIYLQDTSYAITRRI